jgi:hypothetical protein
MRSSPRLPNLVLAGAPKCGTTSLYRWLADHPQVCASRTKATRFFVDASSPLRPAVSCHTHGLEAYAAHFAHGRGDEPIVCEGTPDYIYESTALERLPRLVPPPRILLVLRRPGRRVHSLYRFARDNEAVLDRAVGFAEYADALLADRTPRFLEQRPILRQALAHSRYADWVARWIEAFPAGHVTVLQFEALSADPRRFMQDLARRLAIDPGFYADHAFARHNVSVHVRSPRLHRLKRTLTTAVRPFAPESARTGLVRLYRKLNTHTRKVPLTDAEREALARLDAYFRPHDRRLADLVPIDLKLWA